MEEEPPSEHGERDERPQLPGDDQDGAARPSPLPPGAPDGPDAQALAMEAEEIRRLVEAGAGSPEAIRELAARLREHREREEALWRAEIKPALRKEGKGRLRGHDRPAPTPRQTSTSNSLTLGLVLLGLVLVVLLAASTSVWVLVLPVVALLAWAWKQGRDSTD